MIRDRENGWIMRDLEMKLRCTTNSRDFKETLHETRAKCDR